VNSEWDVPEFVFEPEVFVRKLVARLRERGSRDPEGWGERARELLRQYPPIKNEHGYDVTAFLRAVAEMAGVDGEAFVRENAAAHLEINTQMAAAVEAVEDLIRESRSE
jgi:hypothetical protein